MDISKLRRGELIAGASGLLLFVFMFFKWYGVEGPGVEQAEAFGIETSVSASKAFDFIDMVLLVTAIVAVGLAVMTAMARSVSLPVAASALTAGLGILATVLVLYRILDVPGEAPDPFDVTRKIGVFLGLLAAAGVAVGGWLSMQEEGTTFGQQADRLQDRLSEPDEPPPPPPAPPSSGGPPPPPPPTA